MTISAAGADEDPADRQALDLEGEDLRGVVLGLVRRGRQLHAACLASAADEHLGLDHDLAGRISGSARKRTAAARPRRGPGHLPRGDG